MSVRCPTRTGLQETGYPAGLAVGLERKALARRQQARHRHTDRGSLSCATEVWGISLRAAKFRPMPVGGALETRRTDLTKSRCHGPTSRDMVVENHHLAVPFGELLPM